MNKNQLNKTIRQLEDMYDKAPNELEKVLNELEPKLNEFNKDYSNYDMEKSFSGVEEKYTKKELKKMEDNSTLFLVIEFILIVLASVSSLEMVPILLFGTVFYVAGMCIGLFTPIAGIIFLFSHGMTGLGLMIYSIIGDNANSTVLSDLAPQYETLIYMLIIFGIAVVLFNVVYNIKDSLRKQPYMKNVVLGLYLLFIIVLRVVLAITNIVPFTYLFNH